MTSCQQDPPFLSIGAHVVIQVENNEKDIKNNKNKTNGKTEKKDLNNNIQLEDSDVDEINNNKSDAYAEISGTLRFIGSVHFRKGIWCGVELEEEKGLNDGSVGGHKYFVCPPQKGVFAPLHKVKAFRPKSEFKGRYHGVLFDCPFEGSFSRTSQPSKSPSLVNFANEFKSRIPIATSADALASKCIFLPENIYLKTANNAENLNVEESAMKRWNIKPQQTSVETLPNNVKKKNLKSRLPVPKRKTKLKDVRKNFPGQSVRRQGKKKVSFKLTPEISEFSQHPLSGLVKRNNKKKSFKKPHKTSLVSTIATDSFETSACNEGSRKTKLKLKLKIPKAGIWLSSDEKAEMGGDDKRTELCGNDGMAKIGRDDVMAEIGGDNEMSEIKTPGSAEIDQLINQSKHLFSKRTKINPLHTSLLSTTNQKFLTFNKHKNKKENIKLSKKTGSEQKFLSKPSLHLAKTVILQYAELLKNSQDGLAAHQKKLAVSKIYDSSDLHNIKNLQQRDSFLKMKEDPLPISSPHHKMKRSDGLFEHSPVKHSVHSTHNTRVSVEIPTNEVEEKNSDSSNDFEVFEGEDLVASSESNFKISPILLSQFDKPLFPDNPAWLSRSFSSCNSDGSIGNVFEELERVLEGGRVLKKWLELSMESIGENEEQHNTIEVGASICVKRGGVELEELGDVKKRNDGFEVEDLGEAKKRYGGLKLEEVSDVIRKDDGSKVEKWDSGIKRDEKKECRMSLISSGSCDTGCAMDFDVSMFETSVLCWSNNGDQINTNDDKPVCGNIDSHSDINENQETNETNKAHNYFMGTSLDLVGNEELLSDVRSSLIPLDMLESGYGEDEGSVEGKVKECNGVGGQSLENESFCLRDVEISLETMCVVESHNNTNNNNNNEKNNNNQNDINNNNNITNKNINDNKNNNDNIGNKDNVINNNNNKVNSNNKNDNEDNDNKNKNNKNIEKEESGEDGVAELKKSDKAKIININKNFEKAKSKFENNKIDKNNVIKNISEKEKLVANENKSSRNVKIEKIILANKNSKEKQQEKGLKNSGKNEVGSSQEKLKTPKNDVKTLIEKTSLNKSIKSIAKQSTVLNKSVQNKPNVSNKRVSETPVKVSNDPRKTDKEKKTKLSPARSKTQIKPPVSQNKTLLLQNKTSSLHHKASLPPKKISLPFNKPPLPKSHTYLQHHRNNALDKKLNDSTRNNIKRSSTFSDKENVVENIKKLSIGGRMSASYDEKNRKGVEGGKKDTRKMSIMVLSESNHSIELTKKDEEFKEIKEKAAKEHDERLKNLEKTFEKKIECLKQEMQAKHEERILTLTRQHDEELKTLELNLKNKYRILLDTMLEENNIRSSEAHLKFQQSIQELTQKFEGENGKLQDQLKSLTQKHESSVTLLKHKLATVERREKELKDHLKLKEKEQKQCQLEVESLTIVLEEKNKEVKSMREQVSLLQQKTEEMPGLREELKRHQHHIEELQSVLDIKTNNEKRLMEEKDEWMMRKEVESQQVMRLSMDNEQLLWRLSTLSPPTSSNVPPNFDLSTSPSNKTAPSNNSFHRFSHNFEPSSDSTLILKTPKSRMSAGL